MKRFEVPYNFDMELVLYYKKHFDRINFLYLPPYKEDAINTRSSIQTHKRGHCYMPLDRDEYEKHLRYISDMGLRFVVLWQNRSDIIRFEQLEYYVNLGASGFIIGNDENAKIIKNYNPSLLVICSLVQRLRTNSDLKRDFKYYDYIVLYYTYNRSLSALKDISILKDKLVLMPNTLCSIECPSFHHWFPTKEKPFNARKECYTRLETMDKCGLIFPEHLYLFDDYVSGYKLQGREYPTEAIKYLCHFYFNGKYMEDFILPFLREDMAAKLFEYAHQTPCDEYYNVKLKM